MKSVHKLYGKGGIKIMYLCDNCDKEISFVLMDKVNNKLVCFECMTFAIENGIRFSFDFEKVN